jgi:hypothetical protein
MTMTWKPINNHDWQDAGYQDNEQLFYRVDDNGRVLDVDIAGKVYSFDFMECRLCQLTDDEPAPTMPSEVREAIDALCSVNEYHSSARILRAWLDQMGASDADGRSA